MDNIIFNDSPLAQYLEGEGNADPGTTAPRHDASPDVSPMALNFAPVGPSTLRTKIKGRLPQPLLILPHTGPVVKLYDVCSRAVNFRLGSKENNRFLERFRYVVIASQLLTNESGLRTGGLPSTGSEQLSRDYKHITSTFNGAVATGAVAFVLVWLIDWTRGGKSRQLHKGRACVVSVIFLALASVSYAYVRRQWLKYLRKQAIDSASGLVTNLQAFDTSASGAITLVQEVELVSRGYRLSYPLSPISRLEEQGQGRRCMRLRRVLRSTFAAVLPSFQEQFQELRKLVNQDDLDRYMDIYDLTNSDVLEGEAGFKESEFEDPESLKPLRTWQFRLMTLRRVLLCSLLALQADGGDADYSRWRSAVQSMDALTSLAGEWSTTINEILSEEEQFKVPPPTPVAATPGRAKLRAQIRNLSSMSQGIRGLQAKMQVLREESNKTLEESDEVTELGASLMVQYESIGADLRSLMHAWENGKTALALNINRHERRISQSSSGLRSPAPSLGGLTIVEEGGPSDALRALNGDFSPRSSVPSVAGSASDEEIFEAMSIPRQRGGFTREERLAKLQEDRIRQSLLREQREANTNMLKELESVINLRPKRIGGARITSI